MLDNLNNQKHYKSSENYGIVRIMKNANYKNKRIKQIRNVNQLKIV